MKKAARGHEAVIFEGRSRNLHASELPCRFLLYCNLQEVEAMTNNL